MQQLVATPAGRGPADPVWAVQTALRNAQSALRVLLLGDGFNAGVLDALAQIDSVVADLVLQSQSIRTARDSLQAGQSLCVAFLERTKTVASLTVPPGAQPSVQINLNAFLKARSSVDMVLNYIQLPNLVPTVYQLSGGGATPPTPKPPALSQLLTDVEGVNKQLQQAIDTLQFPTEADLQQTIARISGEVQSLMSITTTPPTSAVSGVDQLTSAELAVNKMFELVQAITDAVDVQIFGLSNV